MDNRSPSQVDKPCRAGIEKPSSQLFLLALEKIGTPPLATYYVGNEYEVDVIGARSVEIEPILIDRDNILPFADCLRFTNLFEVAAHLINTEEGDRDGI